MEKVSMGLYPDIKRRELSKDVMLLILCLASIALSLVAVILVINGQGSIDNRRLDTLEKVIEAISQKLVPEAESDIHKLSKRDTEYDPEIFLNRILSGDLSYLRGPAGRDGRDGRDGIDGKDCNPADCTAANTDSSVQGTGGGSTYIRWGRTSCANSSQLLYTGLAAGQHYTHHGGASNYVCLPPAPEYNEHVSADTGNFIYGAEYESGSHIFNPPVHDQDVPCAACYAQQRSATIMIPAIRTCPDSWTKEYEGYLMAGHRSHAKGYNYVCVDQSPETIPGGHPNLNGALFYFVQGSCKTLGRCPPYIERAELTCVVCSK